jgi:hypothetical protein
MPELFSAILHPNGPNYESWRNIFPGARVPLESPQPIKADLGEEKNVEVYRLNLTGMTLKQRATLFGAMAQKFGVPIFEIEQLFAKDGFVIRANDVIVSISQRAVL